MNLSKFSSNFKSMQAENHWGRIIIALCLMAIILLSVKAFSEKTIVTLMPPNLAEQAQLHHNKAQEPIHQAWSLYVAESLGNVTPGTVDFVRTTLDPILGPSIRAETLVILDRQIDMIKRDQVSFSFEPREVQFDEKTGITYVVGRHYIHELVGEPERTNRTYEFRWQFKNYLPVLVHLDTYEGAPRVKDERIK